MQQPKRGGRLVDVMDDIRDHEHDDDSGDMPMQLTPEQLTFAREKAEQLEQVAQKLGLYQEGIQLALGITPEGPRVMIMAEFLVGDVAWSNRIQDPEAHSVDSEFRDMATAMEEEEFEAYRTRIAAELEAKEPEDG